MTNVVFTNAENESISLGSTGALLFVDIAGLNGVASQSRTAALPFQHGSKFIESRIKERTFTIKFAIHGADAETRTTARQSLFSVFNPVLGEGYLSFTIDGLSRRIKSKPSSAPVINEDESTPSELLLGYIQMIAYDPFFLDSEATEAELATVVSMWEFPTEIADLEFSVDYSTGFPVINYGDVPTPITLTFEGEVVNPKVTNETTGDFIELEHTIPSGSRIEISTEPNNKYAKLYNSEEVESDVFKHITLNSTLFQLDVGLNLLVFTADSGADAAMTINYRNKYMGV